MLRSVKPSSKLTPHDFEEARDWTVGYDQDGYTQRTLIGHSGPVYDTSYVDPDGRLLASCSEDGSVRLWSTDTYSCLLSWAGTYPVWSIATGN